MFYFAFFYFCFVTDIQSPQLNAIITVVQCVKYGNPVQLLNAKQPESDKFHTDSLSPKDVTLLSHIKATIYGNCIGDAIGLLTEFMTKEQAQVVS